MHFNNIYILFLTLGIMLSQTYYSLDQLISKPTMEMSARGYALGQTGLMKDNNSFWVISNPAALVRLDGLDITFSNLVHRYKEHRSIKVNDSFGGYFADASYVFNENNNDYYGFSISYKISDKLAIGQSYQPYHNYNYNYIEAVHDASYDLNRDPLVGYHKEKSSGLLSNLTSAISYEVANNISLGLSYNYIGSEIVNRVKAVEVIEDSDNLASSELYNNSLKLKFESRNFLTLGIIANVFENLIFSFNYKNKIEFNVVEYVTNYTLNDSSANDFVYKSNDTLVQHTYQIPTKFSMGWELKPRQEIPATIIFQYDLQKYSGFKYTMFDDSLNFYDKKTFHFGIEFFNKNTPVRFGMIYENSIFQRDLDNAIFTFGIGKRIYDLDIDLAANYSTLSYSYLDQFIPNNDLSNPSTYEKITEINFGLQFSISYKFKL